MSSNYNIVGVDEAGRGPLAGPVAVGVCVVDSNFNFSIFDNLKDSKKLSERRREEIFNIMVDLKKSGELNFAVALVSHNIIDTKGISYAIREGIKGALNRLKVDLSSKIFLDGSLKAPEDFVYQKTIIKGDELVPVISLASIAAKVTRDKYMKKLAKDYPEYGFEIHKGYGTKFHKEAILKYGPSTIHRKTFL